MVPGGVNLPTVLLQSLKTLPDGVHVFGVLLGPSVAADGLERKSDGSLREIQAGLKGNTIRTQKALPALVVVFDGREHAQVWYGAFVQKAQLVILGVDVVSSILHGLQEHGGRFIPPSLFVIIVEGNNLGEGVVRLHCIVWLAYTMMKDRYKKLEDINNGRGNVTEISRRIPWVEMCNSGNWEL